MRERNEIILNVYEQENYGGGIDDDKDEAEMTNCRRIKPLKMMAVTLQ